MRAPHGQKTPSSPRIQITSTIICLLKRQAYPCFDLEIGISRILKASLVSSSSVSTNPTPHLYGFSWPTSLPTNSPTPPRSYIYKQSLSLLYTQWSAPLSLSLYLSQYLSSSPWKSCSFGALVAHSHKKTQYQESKSWLLKLWTLLQQPLLLIMKKHGLRGNALRDLVVSPLRPRKNTSLCALSCLLVAAPLPQPPKKPLPPPLHHPNHQLWIFLTSVRFATRLSLLTRLLAGTKPVTGNPPPSPPSPQPPKTHQPPPQLTQPPRPPMVGLMSALSATRLS